MKIHVNISTDRTDGFGYHQWSPPGIPASMGAMPSHEGDTAMSTGQGANKLTSNVLHKGKVVVLDGHDCGAGIIDLTIIIPNGQYPWIWPNSSRKIVYAASTVLMNGTPTGCADLSASFPITMTTCGVVTSPLGLPRTNGSNTVLVGMTDADLVAGIIGIIATMLGDIIALLFGLFTPKNPLLKRLFSVLDIVGGKSGLVKWLVGSLAGVAIGIARWIEGGKQGPITITIPPPTKEKPPLIIDYDPATGKVTEHPTDPLIPNKPQQSTPQQPTNMVAPAGQDWGHSLDPPDDRPGWAYDHEKGWVTP